MMVIFLGLDLYVVQYGEDYYLFELRYVFGGLFVYEDEYIYEEFIIGFLWLL